MSKLQLTFGYGAGVPDNAQAAWGARAIVNGYGYGVSLDIPHDRISFAGEDGLRAKLIKKLKAISGAEVVTLAEAKLAEGLRPDDPVDIYEDGDIAVVGRLAGGYFYLAAYLKAEEPGILLPRKATGEPGTAAGGPIWLKLIRAVLDSEDKDLFKLLDVGPGEDGQYREAYAGADIVFPSYDEAVVRVVPKSDQAADIIEKALASIS